MIIILTSEANRTLGLFNSSGYLLTLEHSILRNFELQINFIFMHENTWISNGIWLTRILVISI